MGGDGIHFCFINGFEGMVFAVSPMYNAPNYVHPLAKNFMGFLRLLFACGDVAVLEQIWMWDEAQFEAFLQDNPPTQDQQRTLSELAEKMKLPTIVFDEVDTGVSGEVANRIGEMMCSIADKIQVLTITHLPQVAALGTHHYKVYKQDVAEETVTAIKSLDHKEKVLEIAGMLSGAAIDAAAIANAESLIRK